MFQKPWTEEYLRECIEDEIALALLHPKWRRRYVAPAVISMQVDLAPNPRRGGSMISPGAARLSFSTTEQAMPPHWRRDWNAAGPLHAELGLNIGHDQDEGSVSVWAESRRRSVTEAYRDHPSKDAATMAAIVRAAVREIEAKRQ